MMLEGYVDEAVEKGKLVRILDDWSPSFLGPYLYYPSRRQPPATLAAFAAFAKAWREKTRASGVRRPPSSVNNQLA